MRKLSNNNGGGGVGEQKKTSNRHERDTNSQKLKK